MKSMKMILGATAILLAGIVGANAQTVSISTLPPGAINNVQTQAIAKVVQEDTGIQMRVVTFNSPAASMQAVQERDADFSFMSNDEVGAAVNARDIYGDMQMKDLQLVATVFPFKVGVVVRADSGIRTIEDLRGKRFPIGWQGFPQGEVLSEALLAAGGLTFDDVEGVPTTNLLRAADDLKAGRLDATIFAIGAPKMAELDAALGGIHFISLPDTDEARQAMAAVRPEYLISSQAAAPFLKGVEDGSNLMQYAMTVVANPDVSEETVYKLAKTLHDGKEGLVAGHPSFGALNPDNLAVQQPGVSYHPGAIKYYKEIGIWPEG
jgi:uncharacterized protein